MNGKADLIIANIIADIIIRMFNDVDNYLNQHGAILTSGIIADRIADVTKAAEEHGFMVEKMNEKAGWAAIIFRRKEDMQ
ncbi:Ribosomal protein L11 methylase [Megamonas hypermegale ART12/1]|nr:Ribosomal protein L11 methylase [Megamonas hypermegale ART12/1]